MRGRPCASAAGRPPDFGPRWQALALALAAAAVQAAFLLETARSLFFRYPLVDAATCHGQALALLAGQGAPGAFWQAPGYPYFLAALEWAVRHSPAGARSLQALLLAPLLSLLVWRVGLRVLPPAWAFGAGLASALTGPLVFYASQLLPAFSAAVLVTAALLLALRADERPSAFRWLVAGAAAGLSTVTLATAAALLPAQAWLAAGRSRGWRGWAGPVAALAAGFLLAVLPVSLRNYAVSGRWVWLSTNGGINLYVGNSGGEPSPLTFQPGLEWDALARRPFVLGQARDDVDASRWFSRRVAAELRADPAGFVKRLGRKALVFWHGRELPRNIDLYGWRSESRLLSALVWNKGICFPAGLLVPLAVAGAIALRRSRPALFLALSLAAFGLLVAVFFPCSRYRVPVLPALVVLAAAGVRALVSASCEGGWRRTVPWAASALALGAAANVPVRWPTDAVRYDARLQNAIGASADAAGRDLLAAKACHEAALRLDPNFADASFDLGSVYERLGYPAAAEACYAAALASRPDHDKAHVNLALHLSRRGQTGEALEHLAAAEAANPLNANAWYNHAAVLLRAGRRREALAPLKKTAELAPAYRGQYERLLREVARGGRAPDAPPQAEGDVTGGGGRPAAAGALRPETGGLR